VGQQRESTSRELFGKDDVIVPGATAVQAQHPTDAKIQKPQSRTHPSGHVSATEAKIEVRQKMNK